MNFEEKKILNIIISIIIFGIVIAIHEFGHFIVAKLNNVKVNEFSIGMGPTIFHRQKGDTMYSLRAIPMGGYVSMEGEDEDSEDENAFNKKTPLQKISIILAGPFMNFILAIILFIFLFFNTGVPVNRVGGFTENSPAINSGLEKNDEIIEINNIKIKSWEDIVPALNANDSSVEILSVIKNGKDLNKEISIESKNENGVDYIGIYPALEKKFLNTITYSFKRVFSMSIQMIKFVGNLVTGKVNMNSVSGPIGIIKQVGDSVSVGYLNVISLVAIISLNLGIINLLPFPALDGGRILFSIIELIIGKKINEKFETYVNMVGMALLIILMLFVSYKDILRIFIK